MSPKKFVDRSPNSLNIGLMNLIWINILAIVIALTSVFTEVQAVDFELDQMTTIKHSPYCSSDNLRNPHENLSQTTHFIAEGFIAIVLISDHSEPEKIFDHYIPTHGLNRTKEFFLLL